VLTIRFFSTKARIEKGEKSLGKVVAFYLPRAAVIVRRWNSGGQEALLLAYKGVKS